MCGPYWALQYEMTVVFALVSPMAEGHLKLSYMDWRSLKIVCELLRLLRSSQTMFVPYHDLYIAANGWFQFHDATMGLQSLHDHGLIHGNIFPVCQRLLCMLCSLSELLFFTL